MDFFNVLVVDDEEDFLDTLVNRLNKRKVDTTGAKSGEEALELMEKKPYDVVILDVKMPGGMDGIETLREIKKIHPLSEVILLTGHGSIETSIEGMKDTNILPNNNSPSDIGVASNASIVFLSFSPAKLSEANTLEAIKGIIRKKGAKKYNDIIYINPCCSVIPANSC